jgi:hypothetical protein
MKEGPITSPQTIALLNITAIIGTFERVLRRESSKLRFPGREAGGELIWHTSINNQGPLV